MRQFAIALLLLGSGALYEAQQQAPPKLAVILMVDQMRADYVDHFKGDWTAGLKRLVT